METYSIETDGFGGYQVRITRADDDTGHTVGAFPTWRQAKEWVDSRSTGEDDLPPD